MRTSSRTPAQYRTLFVRSMPLIRVFLIALAGLASKPTMPAQPNLDGNFQFHIKRQPIDAALLDFSRQAQIQVLLAPDVGTGYAPPVDGLLPARSALEELLQDTGLEYTAVGHSVGVTRRRIPLSMTSYVQQQNEGATRFIEQDSMSRPLQSEEEAKSPGNESPLGAAPSRPRDKEAVTAEHMADPNQAKREQHRGSRDPIEEVIVTAQKREERLQDVPISISVLRGDDLEKSTEGVFEALNHVPGVVLSTSPQGGGGLIEIRGVGAGGALFDGSSPVAYYLDSVPFGLVRNAIVPDANTYDLERIEVLRGPQGTLYGANAENGVVRILTNDADLTEFTAKARASLSTTDGGGENYRGDVAVNAPIIDGKLAIRAVAGYGKLSGWIDRPTKTNANDADLRTYRIKLNAEPTEDLSIALSAFSVRDNYGAPSAGTRDGHAIGDIPEPMSTDYDAYGMKIAYRFPKLTVSSATSYLKYSNQDVEDLTPFGIPLPGLTGLSSNVISEELIVNSTHTSEWRWSAGSFFRYARDRLQQSIPEIFAIDLPDHSKSEAVFGELSKRFLENRLEWTLGLRYFHDGVFSGKNLPTPPPYRVTDSFNSTTPRAVLTWYPSSDVTVYGSFSEGFRSGVPLGYTVAEAAPNLPPLKPDKLYNYEIGAKSNLFDNRVSVDTALYYIDWHAVQQTISVPYQGIFISALVNGKSASGVGLDAAITARPIKSLDLGVTFSWNNLSLDSDIVSAGQILFNKGDRLNYSSAYTGGVFADYSFPIGSYKGRLSASANYSSRQSFRSDGFATFGDPILISRASFSIDFHEHLSATAFVDNANNERGAAPATSPVSNLEPRIRPRTMGVQLEYRFK